MNPPRCGGVGFFWLALYPGKYTVRYIPRNISLPGVSMSEVRRCAFALLACATAAGAAQSQEAALSELGTVEVIGKRIPTALAMTVDTVTSEELAAQHRDDLSQALELMPGISTVNLGQRRERLISLRRFDSRQVPLFLGGVPVYLPYAAKVDLARFGGDYVSGNRGGKCLGSLLHGPNIMGLAINVLSR